MHQRIVIRRSEDVIGEADAIARHIVFSEEAKCLSSITQVGNGGSGSVFALHFKNGTVEERVQSKTPNHCIARKIIFSSTPEKIKEHQSEVESLKQLLESEMHPNIIRYVADGILIPSSIRFIDLEFCEMNLNEYIHGTRAVEGIYGLPPWDKHNPNLFLIIAIFQQLLSGLAFIHGKNLIHRDLDPQNGIAPHGRRRNLLLIVLYSATYGWWKISDLGFSSPGSTSDRARATSNARGKPGYRAPELLHNGQYNKKGDIWSLGCILHVLCFGIPAFQSDIEASEYARGKKRLDVTFPFDCTVSHIMIGTWIGEMVDWDPHRRPTPEAQGKRFWQLLPLLEGIPFSTRESWKDIDFLLPCNLLSTDLPSDNLAMSKNIPPRWEHLLFQGAPHSHSLYCLKHAEVVATARDKILGSFHPFTVHSKARSAWTSFYTRARDNLVDEFRTLLKETREADARLVASYHAGVGWTSENYEESIKNFETAIEILHNIEIFHKTTASDQTTCPEALSYTVALLKTQLKVLGAPPKKSRKRKLTTNAAETKQPIELASAKGGLTLLQMQLEWNAQQMHPKLGKDHPEAVQSMVDIGLAYENLSEIKKREGSSSAIQEKHCQAKEVHLRQALEIGRKVLGEDHPDTLWLLHEVAQMDLKKKGRTGEGIHKLERALIQQRYVLGDEDPDTVATIDRLKEMYKEKGELDKLAALPKKAKAVAGAKRRASIKSVEEDEQIPLVPSPSPQQEGTGACLKRTAATAFQRGSSVDEVAANEDSKVYCFCLQDSFGDMVACDNENCEREWFHLPCVGLTRPPQGKWYCHECLAKKGTSNSSRGRD